MHSQTPIRRRARGAAQAAGTAAAAGFTLVELIVVIALLGILAAIALPRFSEMQRDARIASLQALRGAVVTAAKQGYAACMLAPATCSLASPTNNGSDTMNRVTIGDATYQFHYGYPIGWGSSPGYLAGIETMVEHTGFVIPAYVSGTYLRDFRVASAPDPTQCYLRYSFPALGSPGGFQVSVVTSGC